ncbi:MAG TPA: universal stress protein [Desulfopila sp.]|nr:universal stress protein [Desulfopila sp.]
MEAVKTIIVPVDLEEHTEKIVEYSAYMAEKLSAEFTIVHVVEPFRAIGDLELGTATVKEYNQTRLKHSEDFLKKLVQEYPSCKNTVVISGEIVEEILDYAKKHEASLIIIGTHGTKGIEKLLLGSVAERVLKRAHCPTLIMNPFEH